MNLYVAISDRTGYDSYIELIAAPTRGAARYRFWAEYDECSLNETQYGVRLVQKDVDFPAGIVTRPADDPLWKLCQERTGMWLDPNA